MSYRFAAVRAAGAAVRETGAAAGVDAPGRKFGGVARDPPPPGYGIGPWFGGAVMPWYCGVKFWIGWRYAGIGCGAWLGA